MLRLMVGAEDLHVSHVEGSVRDVLLKSIKVRVFLPSTRMFDTLGPALGDNHCSLRVNCHHLADDPNSDFTLSRGASLFDLASLTALSQGLLHLVQRCVVDVFIDNVCKESALSRIFHGPTHTVMNETKLKRITGNLHPIRKTLGHRSSDET